MPRPKIAAPKYGLHKATGQAVVYINRKPIYLGLHGSAASKKEYFKVIGQLADDPAPPIKRSKDGIPLATPIVEYIHDIARKGASEWKRTATDCATEVLLEKYGATDITDFGVAEFEQWRQSLIDNGSRQKYRAKKQLSAKWINEQANIVKRLLRWAVGRDLFPRRGDDEN